MLIAVPTEGKKGLKDRVSQTFARSQTVTLISLEEGVPRNVEVRENTAAKLSQGAGPLMVKNLKDWGVQLVLTGEIGPGSSTIAEAFDIKMVKVEPGILVSNALNSMKPIPKAS